MKTQRWSIGEWMPVSLVPRLIFPGFYHLQYEKRGDKNLGVGIAGTRLNASLIPRLVFPGFYCLQYEKQPNTASDKAWEDKPRRLGVNATF